MKIKNAIIQFFYEKNLLPYFTKSYSQEGEDLILKRYFEKQEKGFYVDIGAHHPFRFSNTQLFYKMGWNGINVEARPGSKKIFDKFRPRDINIESPISDKNEELTYYEFNESALNGFSREISNLRESTTEYNIVSQIRMKTQTLEQIFDMYLEKDKTIDFMTIDVEGWDFKVLLSNNWKKYSPQMIIVEDLGFDIEVPDKSEIYKLLKSYGYKVVSKTYNSVFYHIY